jgi:hypothetical protein
VREKCVQEFGRNPLKERDYYEELGIGGRVIIKWILRKYYWRLNWIHLPQDREHWRVLARRLMHLRVP